MTPVGIEPLKTVYNLGCLSGIRAGKAEEMQEREGKQWKDTSKCISPHCTTSELETQAALSVGECKIVASGFFQYFATCLAACGMLKHCRFFNCGVSG